MPWQDPAAVLMRMLPLQRTASYPGCVASTMWSSRWTARCTLSGRSACAIGTSKGSRGSTRTAMQAASPACCTGGAFELCLMNMCRTLQHWHHGRPCPMCSLPLLQRQTRRPHGGDPNRSGGPAAKGYTRRGTQLHSRAMRDAPVLRPVLRRACSWSCTMA